MNIKLIRLFSIFIAIVTLTGCEPGLKGNKPADFQLISHDIKHNKIIPKQFACAGQNISPHLTWNNIPNGTKSFAVICEDPDAPDGTFVHWILFNIPELCGANNYA